MARLVLKLVAECGLIAMALALIACTSMHYRGRSAVLLPRRLVAWTHPGEVVELAPVKGVFWEPRSATGRGEPVRARRQQKALFWKDEPTETEILERVMLDDSDRFPLAVCNDGSRGAYYVKENPDSKIWLIYLQGTGWCWDKASCEERRQQQPFDYVSSLQMAPTVEKTGVFSPDDSTSPFAGANKVFVPSCSSDAFVGNVGAHENDVGWHFRGQELVKAVLSDLQEDRTSSRGVKRRSLAEGHTVYWAGCSSGARGALFTFEYVAEMLPAGVQVLGLFDSPLWVDVQPLNKQQTPLRKQVESVLHTMGASTRLGACADTFPDEQWKCLLAQYRAPLVEQPYFLIASQFDSALLKKNLGQHSFLSIPGLWKRFDEPPYDELQLRYAAPRALPEHSFAAVRGPLGASCHTRGKGPWESFRTRGKGPWESFRTREKGPAEESQPCCKTLDPRPKTLDLRL